MPARRWPRRSFDQELSESVTEESIGTLGGRSVLPSDPPSAAPSYPAVAKGGFASALWAIESGTYPLVCLSRIPILNSIIVYVADPYSPKPLLRNRSEWDLAEDGSSIEVFGGANQGDTIMVQYAHTGEPSGVDCVCDPPAKVLDKPWTDEGVTVPVRMPPQTSYAAVQQLEGGAALSSENLWYGPLAVEYADPLLRWRTDVDPHYVVIPPTGTVRGYMWLYSHWRNESHPEPNYTRIRVRAWSPTGGSLVLTMRNGAGVESNHTFSNLPADAPTEFVWRPPAIITKGSVRDWENWDEDVTFTLRANGGTVYACNLELASINPVGSAYATPWLPLAADPAEQTDISTGYRVSAQGYSFNQRIPTDSSTIDSIVPMWGQDIELTGSSSGQPASPRADNYLDFVGHSITVLAGNETSSTQTYRKNFLTSEHGHYSLDNYFDWDTAHYGANGIQYLDPTNSINSDGMVFDFYGSNFFRYSVYTESYHYSRELRADAAGVKFSNIRFTTVGAANGGFFMALPSDVTEASHPGLGVVVQDSRPYIASFSLANMDNPSQVAKYLPVFPDASKFTTLPVPTAPTHVLVPSPSTGPHATIIPLQPVPSPYGNFVDLEYVPLGGWATGSLAKFLRPSRSVGLFSPWSASVGAPTRQDVYGGRAGFLVDVDLDESPKVRYVYETVWEKQPC